jgi:hypothetical protein
MFANNLGLAAGNFLLLISLAVSGSEPLVQDQRLAAGQHRQKLQELHAWAGAQHFEPPLWLRQADLQTMWYVIRDIAARVRDDRISPRQIWAHIMGQCEAAATGAAPPLCDAEAVKISFEDEGFLTGLLNRSGNNRRLVILFHGLEGSVQAAYMRSVARDLLRHQICALRVNMVNCGGSEACSRRFYHAGFTKMLDISVRWAKQQRFEQIVLVGFSLGANLVLKYLGDADFSGAREVVGAVAVSVPIDLAQGVACIDRARNKFYRYRFLQSMHTTFWRKQQLFPDLFPKEVVRVRTIAEFDDQYTAPANSFSSGIEYYQKTSSISYLAGIDRPTLILHAQDDVFIPFDAFRNYNWRLNPNLIRLFPERGGHIGFHSSARENWMEKRVTEFCNKLMT